MSRAWPTSPAQKELLKKCVGELNRTFVDFGVSSSGSTQARSTRHCLSAWRWPKRRGRFDEAWKRRVKPEYPWNARVQYSSRRPALY
jgi:hypothetical protein